MGSCSNRERSAVDVDQVVSVVNGTHSSQEVTYYSLHAVNNLVRREFAHVRSVVGISRAGGILIAAEHAAQQQSFFMSEIVYLYLMGL